MTDDVCLTIEHADGDVVCPVKDGPVSIGRHADNTIVIDDDRASRHHCVIEKSKDGYLVRDLDSRNGTKLNNIAIRRARLESGDVIRIGKTEIHFTNPNEDTSVDLGDGDGSGEQKKPRLRWTGTGWEDDDAPISIEQVPSTRARMLARDANEGIRRLEELLTPYTKRGASVDDLELLSSRRVRLEPEAVEDDVMGEASANGAQVLSMVVYLAIRRNATDIHVEPTQGGTAVRLRVDDTMEDVVVLQPRIASVVSRLVRVLADFELLPSSPIQEGQFLVRQDGREHNFWVSATPSVHGERFVLRIEREGLPPESFEGFDLPPALMSRIGTWMSARQGMLVIAGPEGSGRTTTGYALMRTLSAQHLSVVSIEPRVDVAVDGVSQIPLGEDGDAAAMLEFVLRQGPDVVMIDDLSDANTARLATEAATRDVLVIATVDAHTCEDASALFATWLDGHEKNRDAIALVITQRLIRILCSSCRELVAGPTEEELVVLRNLGEAANPGAIHRHSGCRRCHQSGYVGRRLMVGWKARDNGKGSDEALLTDALRMLRAGTTTLDEISRVM